MEGEFERFSNWSRKAMALANREAMRDWHGYIGVEHILLGIIDAGGGAGVDALKELNVEPGMVRSEVERLLAASGDVGRTPRARKVIECAIEEARSIGQSHIGTGHMLIGVLRVGDDIAAQALTNLGVRLEEIRHKAIELEGFGEGE
jgi:ATP-dependent Clp protease ATP-binding subunit ClpC